MSITLQIHEAKVGWINAAKLHFSSKDMVWVEYDIDYASEHFGRSDLYSISLTNPVSLEIKEVEIPGYIVDLIPQGNVLKKVLAKFDIRDESAYEKILTTIPFASPGNIRVAEPWAEIESSRPSYCNSGFSRDKIIEFNTEFINYMDRHGAPIGGTSGAAGGAPKFLLREDAKGMFHADGFLADEKTKQAWLIKLPFTDSANSKLLLKAEKSYYDLLSHLGLNVGKPLEWYNDVLFIPRFDRVREADGLLHYYGLESFYSAHSINQFGVTLFHEKNLKLIEKYSSQPEKDIIEYFKRDIVYRALSNTDNHGRNSSFIKLNGEVKLSPIYDVTAMKFFRSEIISSLTLWADGRQTIANQLEWIKSTCRINQKHLQKEVGELREYLLNLKSLLVKFNVPNELIEMSANDREMVTKELKEIKEIKV